MTIEEIFVLVSRFSVDLVGASWPDGMTSIDRSDPQWGMPAQPYKSGCDRVDLPVSPGKAGAGVADRPDGQRGFTLLELLVVLAILGLLVGLVAPAVLHQLSSAKDKIAHQSIERLASVLDMYKLDVGTYPTTEQGLQALITSPPGVARWNGPYLKGDKIPEDPWGHPLQYHNPSQRPGHDFDLYSLGPTGQPGTAQAAIYNE